MNGRHQRGMAIISALLIVTVVAVIAAGLIARQGAYIRGLESEQLRIRASWMLRGGLEWSRQLLLEDSRRDPLTRLDQRWARPMRDLRLSDAELLFNGRMEDEQGKFNLRNLLVDQRPDAQEQANFERLAGLLGVRPEDARLIVERVLASYARLPAEAPLADTRPRVSTALAKPRRAPRGERLRHAGRRSGGSTTWRGWGFRRRPWSGCDPTSPSCPKAPGSTATPRVPKCSPPAFPGSAWSRRGGWSASATRAAGS